MTARTVTRWVCLVAPTLAAVSLVGAAVVGRAL
jgi:hypothetical protein